MLIKYKVIWWIRSENPETLSADCAALAKPLNLPEKDSADQEMIHKAVRKWLEQNTGWLVVFDNAPEPKDIKEFMPHCETGHVIVTSRYKFWSGVATPVTVIKMGKDEAIAFILKRTGKTDVKAAKELAKELDYLPLALDQAGAYIEATGISITDYLDLYHQHKRKILEKGTSSEEYDASVATTWEVSFDKLKEESKIGEEILNLCAFLAPDAIPKSMIIDGNKFLPESLADAVTDTLAFNDALAALGRYSLVKVGEENLSLHRLVQAVTRDKLSADEKTEWVKVAVEIVNDIFPKDSHDVRTWDTCSGLLSHATIVADFAEDQKVASDATGRLLNQFGGYLLGRGEYNQAKKSFEHAREVFLEKNGKKHPNYARILHNLSIVLLELGDRKAARSNIECALEIDLKIHGENHPAVASDLLVLGNVLHDLGDYDNAEKNLKRAREIYIRTYGESHHDIATVHNSLANLLSDLGDFEGARLNSERAILIFEKIHGLKHPSVATARNNLGSVFLTLRDLECARVNFVRAHEIFKEFFGDEHPSTKAVLENLESLKARMKLPRNKT